MWKFWTIWKQDITSIFYNLFLKLQYFSEKQFFEAEDIF